MEKDQAKQIIKQQEPTFLQQAKKAAHHHPTYVCPWCGNGSGRDGTGIERSEKNGEPHYICHRCGHGGDIITLWQKAKGEHGYLSAMASLCDYYNVDCDYFKKKLNRMDQHQQPQQRQEGAPTHTPVAEKKLLHQSEPVNLRSYFRRCHQAIQGNNYLKTRGISEETIDRFNIGLDENFTEGTGGRPWKAIIFPTSDFTFNARNTDPLAEGQNRYRKTKNNEARMFNGNALWEADCPVFVVEGEIDALSIIEAGWEAVAIGGTGDCDKFLSILKNARPAQPLVIALDNDKGGEDAAKKLAEQLDLLEITYWPQIDANPDVPYTPGAMLYGKYKDANDALVAEYEQFSNRLDKAAAKAQEAADLKKEAAREEYIKSNSAGAFLEQFKDSIANRQPAIPTGYKRMDKVLEGGLYEGLYVVGALTSLGKTTYIMQMADQIAKGGTDVLIFALEMSREQLMARSISKNTLLRATALNKPQMAKSCRDILQGDRWPHFGTAGIQLIQKAMEDYREYADHIFIMESIGLTKAAEVAAKTKEHIRITGHKPVVIVDYLQILAPADPRATEKMNTDEKVLTLKQLSRDCKIPVIAISSINRNNYAAEITMEAMKESGGIDYGCDVVIGMQLEGAGTPDFDATTAKEKSTRKVECVVLKNREGATGLVVTNDYFARYNYFLETGTYRKSQLKEIQATEQKGSETL